MSYTFPLAKNVFAAEVTYFGTVRPFFYERNSNGKLVLKKKLKPVQIADNDTFEFTVTVDQNKSNVALVSHEFADWGSDVYQNTSTMFFGMVWPFGEEEIETVGTTPAGKHIGTIKYTLKRELRKRKGSSEYVWVLGWTTAAGETLASSTIDLVRDKKAGKGGGGGGGRCYITLRLPEGSGGKIDFGGKFKNHEFGIERDTKMSFAPAAPRGSSKIAQTKSLSEAFTAIQNIQKQQWDIAHSVRQTDVYNEDYLNPIRQAISEHAKALTLEALAKHSH